MSIGLSFEILSQPLLVSRLYVSVTVECIFTVCNGSTYIQHNIGLKITRSLFKCQISREPAVRRGLAYYKQQIHSIHMVVRRTSSQFD